MRIKHLKVNWRSTFWNAAVGFRCECEKDNAKLDFDFDSFNNVKSDGPPEEASGGYSIKIGGVGVSGSVRGAYKVYVNLGGSAIGNKTPPKGCDACVSMRVKFRAVWVKETSVNGSISWNGFSTGVPFKPGWLGPKVLATQETDEIEIKCCVKGTASELTIK